MAEEMLKSQCRSGITTKLDTLEIRDARIFLVISTSHLFARSSNNLDAYDEICIPIICYDITSITIIQLTIAFIALCV